MHGFGDQTREATLEVAVSPEIGPVDGFLSGTAVHRDHFIDENGDGFFDVPQNTRVALFGKGALSGPEGARRLDVAVKYYDEQRTGGLEGFSREFRGTEEVYGEALSEADTSGHPVLVHIYAPWCGWCRKMETDVYPSEGVRNCLDQFVLTRLNREDNETTHVYQGRRLTSYRLATMLRADAVPTVVLLASDGRYLLHLPGVVEPRPLQTVLAYMATEAYRDMSFETFRAEGAGACEEL